MRVQVDRTGCQGHARCWSEAPEIFMVDEHGYSIVTDVEVEPMMEAAARRGARACPEQAIKIVDAP